MSGVVYAPQIIDPLTMLVTNKRYITWQVTRDTCPRFDFINQNTPNNIQLRNMKLKIYFIAQKSKKL